MEKQNLRKIIITLSFLTFFLFVSSRSHAASSQGAYVYKVNPGSPVIELDKYRVSTITRGGAANQPFKVLSQTVPKVLFRQVFKKLLGVSPYGIGALAAYEAYGYFMNESNELTKSVSSYSGLCRYTNSYGNQAMQAGMTQADCAVKVFATYDPSFERDAVVTVTENYVQWIVNGNFLVGSLQIETTTTEESIVNDADFLAAHDAYIANNPTLNHNDMFNDEYGNVIPEMFPNPEYVEFTQADIDLIELYEAGLMQSDDPNAANYYPPETIAKAKLLSETKAAQDAKTAEQEAKDLTEDEKLPITQAQHKTNQLEAEARAELSIAESVSGLTGIDLVGKEVDMTASVDQGWTDMTTMLNTTNDLPSSNFANYFDFTSSTGCETIPLPYFGVFPNAEQCVKLGTVKTFLAYFLSVLLAWNMINTVLKEAN